MDSGTGGWQEFCSLIDSMGCGTKFLADCAFHFAFHFEAPEKIRSPSLKFSIQLALNHIALGAPKPWRRRAEKKQRKIRGSGFSLMSDGCDNLLQLPCLVMFAACADFS
jgi:hypothetical protein